MLAKFATFLLLGLILTCPQFAFGQYSVRILDASGAELTSSSSSTPASLFEGEQYTLQIFVSQGPRDGRNTWRNPGVPGQVVPVQGRFVTYGPRFNNDSISQNATPSSTAEANSHDPDNNPALFLEQEFTAQVGVMGNVTQGSVELAFTRTWGTGPTNRPTYSATVFHSRDLDGDGTPGAFGDYLKLSTNFGMTGATPADGDLDGDGVVAFADFLLLFYEPS